MLTQTEGKAEEGATILCSCERLSIVHDDKDLI